MAKLKLQLEDLLIDSFDTTPAEKGRGTVFGEQCTCWTRCGQNTCPGCPTCDASCNGTCAASCAQTCAYTCDDASCAGTCGDTCDYSCNGDTCFVSCRMSECWQGNVCVVW
jgi:hypothetical protein